MSAAENTGPIAPKSAVEAANKQGSLRLEEPAAIQARLLLNTLRELLACRALEAPMQIGFRRCRDARWAMSRNRIGYLQTGYYPCEFTSVIDLVHVLECFDGGKTSRYHTERRATLRAVLYSGDSWEFMLLPPSRPAFLCKIRGVKGGAS